MRDENDVFLNLEGLFEMHGLLYISQYILNTNMAAFQLKHMNEEDKKKEHVSKENEESIITENELITQDNRIIDRLYKKYDEYIPENIEELYDESNKNNRYCLMISSAALLRMESINEKQWQPILERIADVLKGLNSRDLISVLEIADSIRVFAIPCIQKVLKNRVSEMSDDEFFRISEYMFYKRILPVQCEEEISKRVENVDPVFIPVYIRYCHKPQDIEKLMDKAKPEDIIQIIIYLINTERFLGINERVIKLISSLSNIQLVRLLISIADIHFSNMPVNDLLKKRINELSKEELSFVVKAYLKSQNHVLRKEIIDKALEQGILQLERGNLYSQDPIFLPEESNEGKVKYNRYCMYQGFTGKGKEFGMVHLQFDFTDMISRVEKGESEIELEEGFYESMDMQNKVIDIAVEKIEYIKRIDELSDRDLLVFIKNIKRFLSTRQAADMLNETDMMMKIRKTNYLQIENYLYNRILEMQDKAAIVLLTQLFDNIDNTNFNSIIMAKYSECEGAITENFELSNDER